MSEFIYYNATQNNIHTHPNSVPFKLMNQSNPTTVNAEQPTIQSTKMRIDIWSDVVCPFCYIGKRKLEKALAQFANRDQVEIVWHSFQLDPNTRAVPGVDAYGYLAQRKDISRENSIQLHHSVSQVAKAEGLDFRFDRAIVANTADAHRLVHLAQSKGLGQQAEEALFQAYFTDGKNIGDHATLAQLGQSIGLVAEEVLTMLRSNTYKDAVLADQKRAQELEIDGVPFFMMAGEINVSGAQPVETFVQALDMAYAVWKKQQVSPSRN
jgi:predicted DsbA family dithiol-disulfide isomerase